MTPEAGAQYQSKQIAQVRTHNSMHWEDVWNLHHRLKISDTGLNKSCWPNETSCSAYVNVDKGLASSYHIHLQSHWLECQALQPWVVMASGTDLGQSQWPCCLGTHRFPQGHQTLRLLLRCAFIPSMLRHVLTKRNSGEVFILLHQRFTFFLLKILSSHYKHKP